MREAITVTHVRDEYSHLHHVTELATRLLQSAIQVLKKLPYLAVKVARERFTVVVQNAPYFVGFPPPQSHRDKAVLKAQTWVHMRDGRGVSLVAMAAMAGLQRRTFLRRFADATGMTPLEYCRRVRTARARELLISGDTPQKMIAQSLGYKDVASFARVFRKVTGLAPGAYRKRFGIPPGEFAPKVSSLQKQRKLPFRERVLAAE